MVFRIFPQKLGTLEKTFCETNHYTPQATIIILGFWYSLGTTIPFDNQINRLKIVQEYCILFHVYGLQHSNVIVYYCFFIIIMVVGCFLKLYREGPLQEFFGL